MISINAPFLFKVFRKRWHNAKYKNYKKLCFGFSRHKNTDLGKGNARKHENGQRSNCMLFSGLNMNALSHITSISEKLCVQSRIKNEKNNKKHWTIVIQWVWRRQGPRLSWAFGARPARMQLYVQFCISLSGDTKRTPRGFLDHSFLLCGIL